ncbi:protein disulfide isomerase [Tritrichomonas foetus]|uniref:Protein disulfide isomerase n=1 Tax=Tritrichomonas foetus TaxID=1144522 RepID=A0A1J4KP59_9EUKA|nr:protein disulfide isomerase [Tritrichomonas foetus]|eukprot:OHT13019.1 protein disulfide isomerase [Tritrichomonas foetus]
MFLCSFALLLKLISSERLYYTLDPDNFDSTLKANKCTLVRYYTQHQEQSIRSFNDYNLVAKSFENATKDILVAGLDCGKYRRECFNRHVIEIPSVRLYCDGTNTTYEGGYSFESIVKWSSEISGAKPGVVHQLIHTPNNRTFRNLIDNNECVFTLFHTPWCGACKRFMPRMIRIARFFKDEPNVKFAEVDADRYRSFLRDYDLKAYPDIRLFVRGEKKPLEYDGKRTPAYVTEFINKYCGTKLEMKNFEGEAGLIDDANAILEEFFLEGKKEIYVQKMKQVQHASFYAECMEGFLARGNDHLLDVKAKLTELLNQSTITEKERNSVQKKLNIISFFFELIDSYKDGMN